MSYPNRFGEIENGMVESASIQDRRERRGWGIHEDEPEPEDDSFFNFAANLSRAEWERIKAEKGD